MKELSFSILNIVNAIKTESISYQMRFFPVQFLFPGRGRVREKEKNHT